ncbi:MAG: hypothetical protein AAB426_13095 [Myxococcota bacterium]
MNPETIRFIAGLAVWAWRAAYEFVAAPVFQWWAATQVLHDDRMEALGFA